jgi:hypothetical protein
MLRLEGTAAAHHRRERHTEIFVSTRRWDGVYQPRHRPEVFDLKISCNPVGRPHFDAQSFCGSIQRMPCLGKRCKETPSCIKKALNQPDGIVSYKRFVMTSSAAERKGVTASQDTYDEKYSNIPRLLAGSIGRPPPKCTAPNPAPALDVSRLKQQASDAELE